MKNENFLRWGRGACINFAWQLGIKNLVQGDQMVGRFKNLTIQQLQSNLQNQFDRVQENLGVTGD